MVQSPKRLVRTSRCFGGGVRGGGQIFISILCVFDLEFRPASVSAENSKRLFKHSKYGKAVGPGTYEESVRITKVRPLHNIPFWQKIGLCKRSFCAKDCLVQKIT